MVFADLTYYTGNILNRCVSATTLIALALMSQPNSLSAQNGSASGFQSSPVLGRSNGVPVAPLGPTISSRNIEILRHRDLAGKPCLEVGGFARPHVVNADLFDHVIEATNNCGQLIKMQIC